ncbi:Crp/Fnr family transcriptional regulator [Nocardioides sp.]|uniref:Crp/Fnr family transcriptional regulator n=1 Tax=Nocardioides sp. TaxID=35761 RepID=UPI002ED9FF27
MSLSPATHTGPLTTVPARSVLFSMTDPARASYLVESGAVVCGEQTRSGRARLWLATSGDVVGEAALLGERTYAATARTLCEATLRVWVRPPMREDFADAESTALLRRVMRRVRGEIDLLERRSTENATARVGRVLLRLAAELGAKEASGAILHHGLSQTELARIAGADRATVNRALSAMARRGWLTAGPGWVVLHDRVEIERVLQHP